MNELALFTGFGSGETLSDPQSLAQEYVTLLLNEKGSSWSDPNTGCSFLSIVRGGARNELAVRSAFAVAQIELIAQLSGNDRSDERSLASAELQEVTMVRQNLGIRVALTNQAGLRYNVSLNVKSKL